MTRTDARAALLASGKLRPIEAADLAGERAHHEDESPFASALLTFHAGDTHETEAALREAYARRFPDESPGAVDDLLRNLRDTAPTTTQETKS